MCAIDDTCPICLEPISITSCRPVACNHVFCLSCIVQWTKQNSSCPMCRQNYNMIRTDNGVICMLGTYSTLIFLALMMDRHAKIYRKYRKYSHMAYNLRSFECIVIATGYSTRTLFFCIDCTFVSKWELHHMDRGIMCMSNDKKISYQKNMLASFPTLVCI